MRVIVAGSQTWHDTTAIYGALYDLLRQPRFTDTQPVIVHGDCPKGADQIANQWANINGILVEKHPAQWDTHDKLCRCGLYDSRCRRAGIRRNEEMVATGADISLVFINRCSKITQTCAKKGLHGSHGSTHTASISELAGIFTVRHTKL